MAAELGLSEKSCRVQPTQTVFRGAKIVKSYKWLRSVDLIGWLPLVVLPSVAWALNSLLPPWAFMWTLAISVFLGLKWVTWWRVQKSVPHSAWRSLAYLLAWPGMDAESLLAQKKHIPGPRFREWLSAVFETGLGLTVLWLVAREFPQDQPLLRGWTGMLGTVLLLHFGIFQIAALIWRSLGIDAVPIMCSPLRSKALGEFWSERWNLGFRQLAHELIFLPLRKYIGVEWATLMVFLISGLIHDLVISAPAQAGYGLPTAYFLLQGIGVIVERSPFGKQVGLGRGVSGWLFMVLVLVAPLIWLFHPPFVMRVIVPFMHTIHAL